jgi:Na+/H+ antiporter NhaD/arsenite permease-like protein
MTLPLAFPLADSAGQIPSWLCAPFALLLLLIAVMPLAPHAIKRYWDGYYPFAAVGLGALVATYYVLALPEGSSIVGHTLREFFSFITLIGSLFVVAGGIHVKTKGEATPMANVVFLAIAGATANLIGTTGASMVFIRPWIRANKIRASAYHVVFFIFVVANVGGALTPVGDPPLFLGYLRGVPFFWLIEHVIVQWLVTMAAILGVFWLYDRRSFKHMPAKLQQEVESHRETVRFEGAINLGLLLGIIGAVFLPDRAFLRELAMLAAAVASWFLTPKAVHEENRFSFGPIKEVAWLFSGIFLTMMPALGYLAAHGQALGFSSSLQYYFASGALSSVLDNAPTYANFFQLAQTTAAAPTTAALLDSHPHFIIGVSLGSVFFGAMTYIGNGPNFMVKSIAHDAGVHCPSFFGYVFRYSLPILLPILVLSGWLFL